jgi:hypothetical protein
LSGYRVAHLDEIPARDSWIPIRDHLDIGAFGVNAYRSEEAGGRVINDHTELLTKHEELYLVLEGHATFLVAGDEVDAPAGTLVYVGDPSTRRSAVAKEARTTVLAAGARPGHVFEVSPWEEAWEDNQLSMRLYREGRYADAAATQREAIERHPRVAGLYYNLACFDSMAGAGGETVAASLAHAIELHPEFRDFARDDSDLDPVRDDPAVTALLEPA